MVIWFVEIFRGSSNAAYEFEYIKTNFRFICASHLQTLNHHCHDFEARFCCPKYVKRTREAFSHIAKITEEDIDKKTKTFETFKRTLPDSVDNLKLVIFTYVTITIKLVHIYIYSTHISEAKKIGMTCKSGIVDDCNEGIPVDETVPENCQGVLIFSETANHPTTCGKHCNDSNKEGNVLNVRSVRRHQSIDECTTKSGTEWSGKKCGWTKFMRFVIITNQNNSLILALIHQQVLVIMKTIWKIQEKLMLLMTRNKLNLHLLIVKKKLLWYEKKINIRPGMVYLGTIWCFQIPLQIVMSICQKTIHEHCVHTMGEPRNDNFIFNFLSDFIALMVYLTLKTRMVRRNVLTWNFRSGLNANDQVERDDQHLTIHVGLIMRFTITLILRTYKLRKEALTIVIQ